MNNTGVWLTLFLCCGWPLIVFFSLTWVKNNLIGRDWTQLSHINFKFPWSKE